MIRNAFRAPGTAGASALAVLALAAALIAAPAASAAGRMAPLFAPPGSRRGLRVLLRRRADLLRRSGRPGLGGAVPAGQPPLSAVE